MKRLRCLKFSVLLLLVSFLMLIWNEIYFIEPSSSRNVSLLFTIIISIIMFLSGYFLSSLTRKKTSGKVLNEDIGITSIFLNLSFAISAFSSLAVRLSQGSTDITEIITLIISFICFISYFLFFILSQYIERYFDKKYHIIYSSLAAIGFIILIVMKIVIISAVFFSSDNLYSLASYVISIVTGIISVICYCLTNTMTIYIKQSEQKTNN
ncbi:MAG: hypothetical protein WCR67_06510 [Bacilli bacterium]